jgi:hypothetical protein
VVKKIEKRPKFSIADFNYIGDLSLLGVECLNKTEEQMLALQHPCVYISTIFGSKHRSIKSHNYIVKSTSKISPEQTAPSLDQFPTNITSICRVTLTGSLSDMAKAKIKLLNDVNIPTLRHLRRMLKIHNYLYSNVLEEVHISDTINEGICCNLLTFISS